MRSGQEQPARKQRESAALTADLRTKESRCAAQHRLLETIDLGLSDLAFHVRNRHGASGRRERQSQYRSAEYVRVRSHVIAIPNAQFAWPRRSAHKRKSAQHARGAADAPISISLLAVYGGRVAWVDFWEVPKAWFGQGHAGKRVSD
jgi:hypothetical protein